MLELKNIYKTFNPGTINEKVALNGLNLTLNEGDFVTVIGGNGAGKSTMLNAVAGTWFVDEGQILIDGQDVTHMPVEKRNIGMVFQSYALFPTMTVYENLAFGLKVKKLSAAEIDKKVKDVDLKHKELGEDINKTFKTEVKTANCSKLLVKKVENVKIEEMKKMLNVVYTGNWEI